MSISFENNNCFNLAASENGIAVCVCACVCFVPIGLFGTSIIFCATFVRIVSNTLFLLVYK